MKKTMTRALVMFLFTVMLVSSLTAGLLGISAGALSFTKVDNAVIAVPETVYMSPNGGASTTGLYYVNNKVSSGSYDVTLEQSSATTNGYIQMYIPGAKSFTYTVSTVTSGVGDVTVTKEGTAQNFDSAGYFSLNTAQISISGTGLNPGATALAEWKFTVTMNDGTTREYYAYTVLYSPHRSVGAVSESRRSGTYNNEISVWITGINGIGGKDNWSPITDGGGGDKTTQGIFKYDPLWNGLPGGGSSESSDDFVTASTTEYYVEAKGTSGADGSRAVGYLGYITVDSSRYTNTNQIPNFKIGSDALRVNSSKKDSLGKYYAWYTLGDDSTAKIGSGYSSTPSGWTQFVSKSEPQSTSRDTLVPSYDVSSINGKRIQVANQGYCTYLSSKNYANASVAAQFTTVNKNALRQAVLQGTSVNRYNYTSATWNAYQSALRKAALALGNPSNADVSSATALTNAKNALKLNKVVFDNLIDFTEWNTSSAGNGVISNVTNSGFTLTSNAGVGEATSGSPFFPVTPGKQYRIDIDITGNNWDVYIFFCDANGTWIDFADGPSNRYSYGGTTGVPVDNAVFTAPNKSEVVKAQIRVDANGGSNAVTFSNIRVYDADINGVSYEAPKAVALNNKYGTLPTPTRAGYNFLGWYKADGTKITADNIVNEEVTYVTSRWEKAAYTIVWKNYDGTELKKVTDVVIGSTEPSYSGATPTKPADVQYTYTFSGWAKSGSPESGTVTYTAQYSTTVNKYTVTYQYASKTETAEVEYNGKATIPNNSTKNADEANHYSYKWVIVNSDGTESDITGDVIVKGNVTLKEVLITEAHGTSDWIIDREPTCTQTGAKHRECPDCHYPVEAEVIPANGHSWSDYVETKAPTCTATGEKERECSVCHDKDVVTLDALGHDYSEEWTFSVDPTCTTTGSKHHKCSRCDSKANITTVPALGHNPGTAEKDEDTVVEPDCTNPGSYQNVTHCTVCGAETSRETVTVPAKGHSWGEWSQTVAPDCTNEGEKVRECTVCDATETGKVAALGHNFSDEWTTDTEATCTSPGSKSHHCTRCDEKSDITPIEMKPHTPGEVKTENINAPSCTEAGSHEEATYCTVCGTETSREVKTDAATGHTDGAVVVENRVKPSCTVDGSHDDVTYCTVCRAETSRTKVTDKAPGHTPAAAVEENRVPSTCTVQGSYDSVVYCSVCDAELSRDTITLPLASHTPAAAVEENRVPSTCTVKGSYESVVYCSVCNAELSRNTVELPLAPHTPADAVEENRNEATCTAAGSYDSVVYCSACNAELSRETKEIAMKPHTPGEVKTENYVEADCETAGKYDTVTYCSVCNNKISSVETIIPATGHTEAQAVIENNVAPKCEEDGSYDTVVYCSVCDKELSRVKTTVPALGHDFSEEWTTDVPASCEEDGSMSHHCSRCDAKSAVTVIPATGHTNAPAVKENVTNATCGTDGKYDSVVYCSVCDKELSRDTIKVPATGAHVYAKELEKVDATCTEPGYVKLACGCSDEVFIEETIPAKGHTEGAPVEEHPVAPDCTNPGSYEEVVYCSVCNAELSRETKEVAALGHTPGEIVKENDEAPDCTNPGSYDNVTYCTVCGVETSRETITVNALGHKNKAPVVENNVPATCEDGGSYDTVVYCSVCNEELSRVTTTVSALGHKEEILQAEDPDCENTGLTEGKKCTVCGKVTVPQEIVPALGHTEMEAVKENETDPTCSATGKYDSVVYCSVCDKELSRETITVDKLPHTPEEAVEIARTPATCTKDGSYTMAVYCSVCDEELSRETFVIEKLGHTPADAVIENNVAPKCDVDGSYDSVIYCTVCEDVVSRTTITVPMLGHTNGDEVIENNVAPDCEKAGSYDTVVYCTVCNKVVSRVTTTVPALGHTQADAVIENNVAPKCEEDGSYDTVVYCSVCNKELSRETTTVPATGHTAMDAVKENDVAPKCDENGSYDVVVYCATCGEVISRETVTVPATGHTAKDPVKENVYAATCTHAGSYDSVVYCSGCGEELSRETVTEEILEHTPSAAVKENEEFGSCLEGGSYDTVVYCSVCGHEISRQHIVVTEGTHTPGSAVIENKKSATCSAPASYDLVIYCSVCGEELSRETILGATIAHKKGRAVKENEVKATCTTPGTYDQVVYCTVCGEEVSRVTVDVGAKGHTIVSDKEVKPTCTTDGKTLGSHCTACGVVIVMQETVPAHGHYETDDYGYDATCTRPGLSYGSHCKKCGVVIIAQEEIPAPGHTDVDGDGICDIDGRDVTDMDPNYGIVVNPDADGDGYIDANECEDCGREHTNFFSSIICFFIRIMRLFGYKIT